MEFFRPYLKARHGARTQLAAALGVCYGSARKATLRMSLTAHSGPWCNTQRRSAASPICEFGILAARARSKENAAIAKSSLPPRGGKTGHSCKAQQDKSVELTDCGQRVLSLRLRQ